MNETLKFILDCEFNKELDNLKKSYERLSLLKHRTIHLDSMESHTTKIVLDEIWDEIKDNKFYSQIVYEKLFETK